MPASRLSLLVSLCAVCVGMKNSYIFYKHLANCYRKSLHTHTERTHTCTYMVYAYSHTAYVNDAFAFACWRSSASYLTAAQPARAACYCNGDTHRHTRTQRQRGSVLLHKMKAIDGKTLPNTEIGSLFADKE